MPDAGTATSCESDVMSNYVSCSSAVSISSGYDSCVSQITNDICTQLFPDGGGMLPPACTGVVQGSSDGWRRSASQPRTKRPERVTSWRRQLVALVDVILDPQRRRGHRGRREAARDAARELVGTKASYPGERWRSQETRGRGCHARPGTPRRGVQLRDAR